MALFLALREATAASRGETTAEPCDTGLQQASRGASTRHTEIVRHKRMVKAKLADRQRHYRQTRPSVVRAREAVQQTADFNDTSVIRRTLVGWRA